MDTDGNIITDHTDFYYNHEDPYLGLNHATIEGGGKKSVYVKELDDGKFLLGGAADNPTLANRNMFIQIVNSNGSYYHSWLFGASGQDCKC